LCGIYSILKGTDSSISAQGRSLQQRQIEASVDHYNHQRYYESLKNVTPSDVYFGRDKAILKQWERIKRKMLEARRLHYSQRAA
jgi:putative transposase